MAQIEVNSARYLIVNADDFGQSPAINRGIIQAIEQGIVTSASLMVHWPAANDAARFAANHPDVSLGLHIDLGEWAYRDGTWRPLYEITATDDVDAVREEIERQLITFRHLTGRDPTHIDSHQHVHRKEPVRSVVSAVARRVGIPTRHFVPSIHYCGSFYGQTTNGNPELDGISVEHLLHILETLPPGVTELGCHPGEAGPPGSMYDRERSVEVATLCHPKVRTAIADLEIHLSSFHSISHPNGWAARPQ